MPDLATELARLAQAERHIRLGERCLSSQTLLVARLQAQGHDSATAEALLHSFDQTLQAWRDHRDLILRTIHDLGG